MSVSVDEGTLAPPRPWGDSLTWLWAVVGMQFATSASWGVLLDHFAFICRGSEHSACARGRLRGWWWRLLAVQLFHAATGRATWGRPVLGSLCDWLARTVLLSYVVAFADAFWRGVT